MLTYRENPEATKIYKQEYAEGFQKLIEKRQKEAEEKRFEYAKNIFKTPETYRNEFHKMLGWPLWGHEENSIPCAESEKLADEENCEIFRMHIRILDEITLTGLFFRLKTEEKRPLVIVQHGGLGTPEYISGLYEDTGNYNHMLERVLERNVHVFAPQLLLWGENYEVPFKRGDIDTRLKRLGSSITAVEVYALRRVLDYFENEPFVSTFGMVGLSYGGFYTLFAMASDTRLKAGISCSFFNKRDAAPWSDWTWTNAAFTFDDAEIACLVYPRTIYLQMGDNDNLFDAKHSLSSFETVKRLSKDVGTDWVSLEIFGGVHEFSMNDAAIEKVISLL